MDTALLTSPEQLTRVLDIFGIDRSPWGTHGHGTVENLFNLIERGDAFLKITARGLALSTQTARALMHNERGQVLVAGNKNHRGLDNSDLQLGFNIPGGLMKEGSDARSTLERELEEEAGLKAGEYVIGDCLVQEGSRFHGRHPNLPVERVDHIFTVRLQPRHRFFELERFEHFDVNDGHLVFKWVPEEVWRAKQEQKRLQPKRYN